MLKTKKRTPVELAREKGFTDGFNFGMEMGRLSIFKKQLNIKNSTWSVNYFNGNESIYSICVLGIFCCLSSSNLCLHVEDDDYYIRVI